VPQLQVSLPSQQALDGPTRVEVSTTSPVRLARADFYLDNTLLQSVSEPPLGATLDPTGLTPGSHTLRVHAYDASGGEAEANVPVEFADTGLFGKIPFWAVLAVVLALPIIALVGIFTISSRRSLHCPTCRRKLRPEWTACPYCSTPEPMAPAAPPPAVALAPPPTPVAPTPTVTSAPTLVPPVTSTNGAARATQLLHAPAKPVGWLVVKSGEHHGTRFRLNSNGETSIGRDGTNDVVLDDPSASREHAKVRASEAGYYLTDLDTTNGTLLNGRQVSRQKLHPGDEVQIGHTTLVFLAMPDA
jgi:hypothetical protein